MEGLDKLEIYLEKGYSSILFIRKSLRKRGTYSIGLGDDKGNVVSLHYDPQRDYLKGGKEYKNDGLDKILIGMAKEGRADLAVDDIKDWSGFKGILKLPEGVTFYDLINEIRGKTEDDILDKLRIR